jgi:uncharacterized protein YdeI (YjbR/CyaY-like superfamily)
LYLLKLNQAITFKDSQEWNRWLTENHAKQSEVWVYIFKKHSKKKGLGYDEALDGALRFGWIDGKMQSVDKDRFVLRFSPRKPKSIWSRRNKERAERLIAQGRMMPTGFQKIEEAKKNGIWQRAYSSQLAEEIPPDLASALKNGNQAWKNFQKLANTYRNMFIRWVCDARTEEVRAKRITEIVKRVEDNKKLRYGEM